MVVRVVDQRDVDPLEPEPLEALLERTADTIGAVIENDPGRLRVDVIGVLPAVKGLPIDVGARRDRRRLADQPADLRRQHDIVARAVGEGRTHPPLRRPVAVEWGCVEVPHAQRPGVADRGDGFSIPDGAEETTDRGATEPESRDLEAGPAERHALGVIDRHRSPVASARLTRVPRVS